MSEYDGVYDKVHKAEPPKNDSMWSVSTCRHCLGEIYTVPGGQGKTWVHESGVVVAAGRTLPEGHHAVRINTIATATIRETWVVVVSDDEALTADTITEVFDTPELDFISVTDETAGDERDREVISWQEPARPLLYVNQG